MHYKQQKIYLQHNKTFDLNLYLGLKYLFKFKKNIVVNNVCQSTKMMEWRINSKLKIKTSNELFAIFKIIVTEQKHIFSLE